MAMIVADSGWKPELRDREVVAEWRAQVPGHMPTDVGYACPTTALRTEAEDTCYMWPTSTCGHALQSAGRWVHTPRIAHIRPYAAVAVSWWVSPTGGVREGRVSSAPVSQADRQAEQPAPQRAVQAEGRQLPGERVCHAAAHGVTVRRCDMLSRRVRLALDDPLLLLEVP